MRRMRRATAAVGLAALLLPGCAPPADDRPSPSAGASETTATPGYDFGYQPLWPFATQADADRWRSDGRAGADAWHADPRTTAQKFTREFLGFGDLNRITTVTEQPREAWVGVGQDDPRGIPITVATLHLARFGPAADAPWEVVGSEDTDLTLDTPAYGSAVQSVTEVGGTISGVDESLHIQARQIAGPVGEFCCVPAGGQRAEWSATVPIATTGPGAVTVVVSTGGHYAALERFAITGLRAD